MSPALDTLLRHLIETAKQNQTQTVACNWCNGINHIKHGTYQRYLFVSSELISIQRYLCKNDQCRRTFSILPHPFLRICRFSICLLQAFLNLYVQLHRIYPVAHIFGVSHGCIARMVIKAKSIFSWIESEARSDASWAPCPCLNPSRFWTHFIRMFAAKFYPKRYGHPATTQYVNCK